MARVRTLVIPIGDHTSPRGVVHATPAECQRWARNINAMRREQIQLPLSWGHQSEAVPHDPNKPDAQRDQRMFDAARWNAGNIEDAEYDPKTGLWMSFDAPGLETDDRGRLVCWGRPPGSSIEVKTAIGEVSAGIRDWRDGKGRVWKRSIVHVALTPLPVVAGQKGFEAASKLGKNPDEPIYLSTLSLVGGIDMAADDMDRTEEVVDDHPENTPVEVDEEPLAPVDEAADVEPEEPGGDMGNAEKLSEAMRCLQDLGLHLPPDTNADNFLDRVVVACHAMEKAEGAEEEEEGLDPGIDDEGGGTDQTPIAPDGAPAVQEQRPIMMSTLSNTKDKFKRGVIAKAATEHKARQAARIKKMVDAGYLPPARAEKLSNRLSTYNLGIDDDAEVVQQKLDIELSALWEGYSYSNQARGGTVRRNVKRIPQPAPRKGMSDAELASAGRKAGEEYSKNGSR